jgi:hypothetical protein
MSVNTQEKHPHGSQDGSEDSEEADHEITQGNSRVLAPTKRKKVKSNFKGGMFSKSNFRLLTMLIFK